MSHESEELFPEYILSNEGKLLEAIHRKEMQAIFTTARDAELSDLTPHYTIPGADQSQFMIQASTMYELDDLEVEREVLALVPFSELRTAETVVFLRQDTGLDSSSPTPLEVYEVAAPVVMLPIEANSRETIANVLGNLIMFFDVHDLWPQYKTSFYAASLGIQHSWDKFKDEATKQVVDYDEYDGTDRYTIEGEDGTTFFLD